MNLSYWARTFGCHIQPIRTLRHLYPSMAPFSYVWHPKVQSKHLQEPLFLRVYESVHDFRNMDNEIEFGFKWWLIGKWMTQWLYKIKVISKFIVTNNEKCGYRPNCGCNEKQNMAHIILKWNKTKADGKRNFDSLILQNVLANTIEHQD